jgi:trigger factor
LGEPEGGNELADASIEADKPISFTLEIEVAPEFKSPGVDGIPVKKPVRDVTDEMVNEEIHRLGLMEGELAPRDVAEPGDYATGHGIIKDKDGAVVLDIDGAVIQVPTKDKGGKGAILGIMVEDFAKQVGSPKPGDVLKIKAKGPAQHETARIRGEPISISFEVSRVDRIIPASASALVQRLGLPDEQRLRDALRTRLQQRAQVQQQTAMRRQVAEHLLEKTTMDLPERLSERQAARALERRRMDLMYRGVNPIQIEEQMAELRSASAEVARRELKLFFILNRVADDLDVKVSENEINARIVQLAMERGEKPENLRTELIRRNQVGFLAQQIREHKAMDALLAKASVTEVPASESDEV